MRIALIGTRGVPARYGGFETCVEEVGRRLVDAGHQVVVYCRVQPQDTARPATYLGMDLVHHPALRRKVLETLSHTALSVGHVARHRTDVAVVFNAANAPLLPVLRASRIPVATHVDGLEWKRAKWGRAGRSYYRAAEALAVRWSDALIADATGISDYYRKEFGAPTELISYGAPIITQPSSHRLDDVEVQPGKYHLVVSRFEPENHVDLVVQGYRRSRAQLPLIVVGSAPYADAYTERIHAEGDDRTRFLGGVWDQELLDQLYANSFTYLHGHSVGGTNPSLLQAIGAGAPTIAYDVVFNREVVGEAGRYFRTAAEVAQHIDAAEADPARTYELGVEAQVAATRYDWDDVAKRYEELCLKLHEQQKNGRSGRPTRPTGRRSRTNARQSFDIR